MKEGMYRMDYKGPTGNTGWGILLFDSGKIWGIDIADAHYDGDYALNKDTGMFDAKIVAVYQKGAVLVTGQTIPEDDFKIEYELSLPTQMDVPVTVTTSLGGEDIPVTIRKVRDAPSQY